jgi:ABC-type branched-subunit amino acid transport system substrate-binding protein
LTTRPVFPASAFVATRLVVAAFLQATDPEDWQEILASAGLSELPKFMVYFDATNGPKSLLALHLASIVRDTSAYQANNRL